MTHTWFGKVVSARVRKGELAWCGRQRPNGAQRPQQKIRNRTLPHRRQAAIATHISRVHREIDQQVRATRYLLERNCILQVIYSSWEQVDHFGAKKPYTESVQKSYGGRVILTQRHEVRLVTAALAVQGTRLREAIVLAAGERMLRVRSPERLQQN
jgi:hypothetical protein